MNGTESKGAIPNQQINQPANNHHATRPIGQSRWTD